MNGMSLHPYPKGATTGCQISMVTDYDPRWNYDPCTLKLRPANPLSVTDYDPRTLNYDPCTLRLRPADPLSWPPCTISHPRPFSPPFSLCLNTSVATRLSLLASKYVAIVSCYALMARSMWSRDPGRGDSWFSHSAVFLNSLDRMIMWCLCWCVLFGLVFCHTNARVDTMLSPYLLH